MRSSCWLTALAIAAIVAVPGATFAQPTQAEVKTALKATNPSLSQMQQMKPMLENYKAQTANANEQQKKAAAKTLVEQLKTVLTPAQQATFKQSMMSQMSAAH